MTDTEFQKKCHDVAYEYLKEMHAGLDHDLEKKHLVVNACAAGYSRGYSEAKQEIETLKKALEDAANSRINTKPIEEG